MTGFPSKIFERAFVFFTQERIGWMVSEQWQTDLPLSPGDPGESAGTPGESPATNGNSPGPHPLEKRREEEIREDKMRGGSAEGASPRRAAGAAPASESEWLAGLRADPAYRGLDVDREYAKMNAWCREKKRQPTRMRFVNWLNRCDKPPGTEGNRPQAEPIAEPKGWKSFLNHDYPESRFSAGQTDEARQWSDLDRSTQQWLIAEMRKKGQM